MSTEIKTWQILDGKLIPIATNLSKEGHTEPDDLESWIASNPEIVGPDIMVIGRQVNTDSGTVDLLGIDIYGNTVIIELKRDALPREALAQAIDYAASVAGWSVDKLNDICSNYRSKELEDAFSEAFPDVDLDSINLNSTQRIVLVGFSIEDSLKRMIKWLSEHHDVNINAVVLSYVKTKGGDELLLRTVVINEDIARERIQEAQKKKKFTNLTPIDFMNKCVPELRSFFQYILDEAERNGFSIYWGTKSYSVRMYLPSEDAHASFLYCKPTGELSFYFAQLRLSDEVAKDLRKQLLSYGIFRESGKKTLVAELDVNTVGKAKEVVDFILSSLKAFVENPEANANYAHSDAE
ncbi:MAG: endonuclease NucS [Methanothrix sp.]|uniref:endonuclease NucS domain-containing protein n=1 Tax=Methanothrix sp. TaxID=90426 RepID=UPI0032AFB914|nr:endonuclease NucS [Methanothrix sp.]